MEEKPLQRKRRGDPVEPTAYSFTAEDFVSDANAGDEIAHYLLARLLNEGVTGSFIHDINERLMHVRKGVLVQKNDKTGQIETHDVWSIDSPPTGAEGVTLAFVQLLKTGAFNKLKACAADDCSKHHFRRGKWCSDRCGSRQRGRDKRKLDKERQML